MTDSDAAVLCALDDRGIAVLTLNRPENRNALSDSMLDALTGHLERLHHQDEVRVVVLRSAHPRVFCAGGDLAAFASESPIIRKYEGLERFPRLFRLLGALGKPVICAANGDVLAGAVGVALACDVVLIAESARFGCPEINVGVFPFMVSALMARNVGRLKANEILMFGELMTAREVERLGLVNKCVGDDEFDRVVDEWAAKLAKKSPLLMRLGKDALNRTQDMASDQALDALQSQLALAFTTEDMTEGVRAFHEKRKPTWRMR